MAISNALLPEFDHEMTTTRSLLAITPAAHADWKPHPKSSTLGDLAMHLGNIPSWTAMTLEQTELDLNPPGGTGWAPRKFETVPMLLQSFDDNVAAGKAAIAKTSDAEFMVPWTLKNAGVTIFTMPRVAVMRSFVLSHLIHHRGQFTVYLRLRDVALPSVYGPTADVAL